MKKRIDDVVAYQGRKWRVAGINEEIGSTYLNRANEMGPGVENLTLPTTEVDGLELVLRPKDAKKERSAKLEDEWLTPDQASEETGRKRSTILKWVTSSRVKTKWSSADNSWHVSRNDVIALARKNDAKTGRTTTNPLPSEQPLVQPVKDWGFKTKKLKLVFEDGRACDWDVPIQAYDDFLRGAWMAVKTDNHAFSLQVKPPPVPSPTAPSPAVNPPEVGSIVEMLHPNPDDDHEALVTFGPSKNRPWSNTIIRALTPENEGKTWRRATR
jgi:hypothetical protein